MLAGCCSDAGPAPEKELGNSRPLSAAWDDTAALYDAAKPKGRALVMRARASVATHTLSAPALTSAWDAARAVAPVVRMSSIIRTCRPETALEWETRNAPRTFKRRCRGVSPVWLSVARRRINVSGASVSRHLGWVMRKDASAQAASSRAWLKPRPAYFDLWSGTGTTSISEGAASASCAIA